MPARWTTKGRFTPAIWFQEPKVWNLQSKISKQAGAHYIKGGGEFRQLRTLAARPRPMGFVLGGKVAVTVKFLWGQV